MTFFSCNFSSQNKGNTLRVNFGTDPPFLDPRKALDNISAYICNMCFDTLTRVDPQGNISLSLASSYELSADQTCYLFKIKPAKWSNGKVITAYDFEHSWKSCLHPAFPCQNAFIFYYIKNAKLAKQGLLPIEEVGIKALDATTLQVELSDPYPHFLELLSTPYYSSYVDDIAEHNTQFLERSQSTFISSGPFYIESYKPQNKMVLRKNPYYWDKEVVQIDTIEIFFISDQSTELSMYEQGDIDWVGAPFSSIPEDAMAALKSREDFHNYRISGLYYYVFNTEVFPFNNANIRKALSLSIHRQALIDHVLQCEHESATRLIPPITNPLEKFFFHDKDLVKAKEYFNKGCQELGISPEKFPKITLSYNAGLSLHYKVAQAIQQQWSQALGISTQLESLEWKVYLDALKHHNFQVARLGVTSLSSDPAFFLEMFAYKDSFANFSGWHSPSLENLFVKSIKTLDPDEKLKIIEQGEELFLEEMPIAPLFFYTQSYLKKDYVNNVVLGKFNNMDLKWATIR
jgi:oligopeptide transport system substrate-binding protein